MEQEPICNRCKHCITIEVFRRTPFFCNLSKIPDIGIYCAYGIDNDFPYKGERIVRCSKFAQK